MEIWEPVSPGTLRATPGLLRDCFTFTFFYIFLLLKSRYIVTVIVNMFSVKSKELYIYEHMMLLQFEK